MSFIHPVKCMSFIQNTFSKFSLRIFFPKWCLFHFYMPTKTLILHSNVSSWTTIKTKWDLIQPSKKCLQTSIIGNFKTPVQLESCKLYRFILRTLLIAKAVWLCQPLSVSVPICACSAPPHHTSRPWRSPHSTQRLIDMVRFCDDRIMNHSTNESSM